MWLILHEGRTYLTSSYEWIEDRINREIGNQSPATVAAWGWVRDVIYPNFMYLPKYNVNETQISDDIFGRLMYEYHPEGDLIKLNYKIMLTSIKVFLDFLNGVALE